MSQKPSCVVSIMRRSRCSLASSARASRGGGGEARNHHHGDHQGGADGDRGGEEGRLSALAVSVAPSRTKKAAAIAV